MIASALLPIVEPLRRIVGDEGLLAAHSDLVVYECDGFVIEKNCPDVVVFPRTTEDVAEIVKVCNEFEVPFMPRGAGMMQFFGERINKVQLSQSCTTKVCVTTSTVLTK